MFMLEWIQLEKSVHKRAFIYIALWEVDFKLDNFVIPLQKVKIDNMTSLLQYPRMTPQPRIHN